MGILDGIISQEDINRVSETRNTPEFENGFSNDMFENDSNDSSFDSLFGDDSESSGFNCGGSSSSGPGGFDWDNNSSSGSSGFNWDGNSSSSGFDLGGSSNSDSFGLFNNNNNKPKKPELYDIAYDKGIEALDVTGKILLEMLKSFKNRTSDDYAYLSSQLIKVGVIITIVGLILGLIGFLTTIVFIRNLGIQSILSGVLSLSSGLIGLGVCANILSKNTDSIENESFESLNDEPLGEDNFTSELEDNDEDFNNDLFGENLDAFLEEYEKENNELFNDYTNENIFSSEDENTNTEEDKEEDEIEVGTLDYSGILENINENSVMTRETLFNTFKPLLPLNTLEFDEKNKLDSSDEYWKVIETICLKSLVNLTNMGMDEISQLTHLESVEETKFSYEIKLKRIAKVKNPDDLAREIQFYVATSDNENVTVTASIHGDFYKIIMTKGENHIVTLGDVLKTKECEEYFLNKKNKLPIINGVTELGNLSLEDAKIYYSMLISGQSRSGKSWNLLSVLMQFMLFNTPYDIEFIIVDPKCSTLFNTLSLMPHVIGLHDGKNILQIFDEIIEIEEPRRKKLLLDNKCDDIWSLRNKGIQLPILVLVIDEYLTIVDGFEDKDKRKEFDGKMRIVLSKMPSVGIMPIIIPHRTTGVVDKTNRILFHYISMVRSQTKEIEDTFGIKWKRTLTQPGDMAVDTTVLKTPMYLKSIALTTSDEENVKFIEAAAKAFYKMGVEIPDNSNLIISCNRDEDYIKNELSGGNIIQYDANNILDDID